MTTCPWCDDPSPRDGALCDACAEGDLSVRWCPELPPGHAERWGHYVGCGVDPVLAASRTREEEKRDSLRAILRGALREFGSRWSGFEFAKAWAGNAILGAMEAWGMDRKVELDAALADLTSHEAGRLRCFVRVM